MNNKSSFLQISDSKFIVNNKIYQIGNIFCLKISEGWRPPPLIRQGGGAEVSPTKVPPPSSALYPPFKENLTINSSFLITCKL